MRNSPRRFVIALTVLASLILFVGSLVLSEHAKAQNPKPTTPADTSKDKQTCEGIKNQLKSLIESVEALTKELDRLRAELDKLDQSLQKYQEYVADNPIKVWLGDHLGTTNSQATINKLNAAKEKLQNEIKLDEEVLPDIKKSIQEILDKIGPCDNKTTPTTKPPTPPVKSTTPVITLNGVPGEPEDCAEFRRNYNFQKNALSQTNLSPQDRERFEKALENSRRGYCQCLIKNHISPLPEICQDITNPQSTSSPTPQPSPTPAQNTNNQVGYHVDSKTGNGLVVTTVDTPQGKIKVNLPDDMAAGDTITGTVEVEPNGKNDAERTQNEGELNGYVIEVGGQKTKVSEKKINCIIPTTLTSDAKTIVLTRNNQRVATSECPISQTPPATPAQTTLPTGGQQGRDRKSVV